MVGFFFILYWNQCVNEREQAKSGVALQGKGPVVSKSTGEKRGSHPPFPSFQHQKFHSLIISALSTKGCLTPTFKCTKKKKYAVVTA